MCGAKSMSWGHIKMRVLNRVDPDCMELAVLKLTPERIKEINERVQQHFIDYMSVGLMPEEIEEPPPIDLDELLYRMRYPFRKQLEYPLLDVLHDGRWIAIRSKYNLFKLDEPFA